MPLVVVGSWIILGMIVGLVISKLYKSSDGPAIGVVIAIACAVVLAAIDTVWRGYGVMSFTPKVLIFAAVGALVGAVVWNTIRSRFATVQSTTVRRSY